MADFVGIVAKFAHQFRQILHNEGGGKWRTLSEFVERMPSTMAFLSVLCDLCGKKICGGLWRILSQRTPPSCHLE